MAEEVPRLFSLANRTIPVLVLHGDSLRRGDSARFRRQRAEFVEQRRQRRRRWGGARTGTGADDEPEGHDRSERKEGVEGDEECGNDGATEARGQRSEGDYYLWRNGFPGKVSCEVWDTMEAAGSLNRLFGWEMRVSGLVQIEKVKWGENERGT